MAAAELSVTSEPGPTELPAWTTPKYDVRKKPPPVPKPRYVLAGVPKSTSEACTSTRVAAASEVIARPRWGQLGSDSEVDGVASVQELAEDRPPAAGECTTNTHRAEDSPGGSSASLLADYKSSWQRWQAMPSSFLEERRQRLLGQVQPQQPSKQPSEEAAAFLELLLSGTEPEISGDHAAEVTTARGAAQVADAARRLQAQAEAAKRRRAQECIRTGACAVPTTKDRGIQNARLETGVEDSAIDGDDGHAPKEVCSDQSGLRCAQAELYLDGIPAVGGRSVPNSEPRSARRTCVERGLPLGSDTGRGACLGSVSSTGCRDVELDHDRRMRDRQKDHERRLRELEEETERERRRLEAEMACEQAERAERRKAQDAWKEELRMRTEKQKREAERGAAARDHVRCGEDRAWREQWWNSFQRNKERAKHREEEHKQWSKGWWEQWKQQEDFPTDDGYGVPSDEERAPPVSGRTVPQAPKPHEAEHARILKHLRAKRLEPLEERKRAWRQLCLQWHPDKCGDKDVAKTIFQYLQGLKEWFLDDH